MFSNYLKIVFRNIFRQKTFSAINIIGLSIGMATTMFIALWVLDEFSFNGFHKNKDDIYLVYHNHISADDISPIIFSPPPLKDAIVSKIPEIKKACRFLFGGFSFNVKKEDLIFNEKINFTDSEFFEIFSFPVLKGQTENLLDDISSIVITERTATKYFGDENPIGQKLIINNEYNFIVTAVVKNVPINSQIQFDFLLPYDFLENLGQDPMDWDHFADVAFVLLQKEWDKEITNKKIKSFIKDVSGDEDEATEMFLYPFSKLYLYSLFGSNRILIVKIFILIGLFILLIACINFMNLSTAQSVSKSKGVGIRKTIGASKPQLIIQYMGESIIHAFISLILALIFVELLIPLFNQVSDKEITLSYYNSFFILIVIVITLFTGLLAGSYPAFYLSSFSPIQALRGIVNKGKEALVLRKILVVFQFSLSIILIIITINMYNQIYFLKNKDIGLDKQGVIYITLNDNIRAKQEIFKDELLKNNSINHAVLSSHSPSYIYMSGTGFEWEGKNPSSDEIIILNMADYDWNKAFNIPMISGRFYTKELDKDTNYRIVINETFQELMGFEDAVGKTLTSGHINYEIIGVIKDFNFKSADQKIEPLALSINFHTSYYYYLFIKYDPTDFTEVIKYIEKTFKKLYIDIPFEYKFLEDDYESLYKGDEIKGEIFSYFSFLAIFISCLGLFGLVSFTTAQRTKEIGIRKTLGSGVKRIVGLILKDYIKWVGLAYLISAPISYILLIKWFGNFEEHIDISILSFIFGGIIVFMTAIITVLWIVYKAADKNPAGSLKYE